MFEIKKEFRGMRVTDLLFILQRATEGTDDNTLHFDGRDPLTMRDALYEALAHHADIAYAANAKINRLQSQPTTFDDIPWEPVTLEALGESCQGVYQFKNKKGVKYLSTKTVDFEFLVLLSNVRYSYQALLDEYTEFRKLPVALHTTAPEPTKIFVAKDSKVQITYSGALIAHCPNERTANDLADKLNRLEELGGL